MNVKKLIPFFLIVAGIAVVILVFNRKVRYIPVVIEFIGPNPVIVEKPDLFRSDELGVVKRVLTENREYCYIDSNNVLFISWRLSRNKELLANYTQKAWDETVKKK